MFSHRIVVSNDCCLLCYQFPTLLFASLLIKKITYFFFLFSHLFLLYHFLFHLFAFIFFPLLFFLQHFGIAKIPVKYFDNLLLYHIICRSLIWLFSYSVFLFFSFVSFLIYHISPLSSQDFRRSKKIKLQH